MASSLISPPPSGGDKKFNEVKRKFPDADAIVTFQRIDKPTQALKNNTDTSAAPGNKIGTIGLSVLMQKCGISVETGMNDVSMAKIKEGMIKIGLAKEFDIWSSPSSRLLDYDLSFLDYVDQVSRLTKAPELTMQVYYGLKKEHDEQTVQDIYRSGNFIIKLVQLKSGKPQGVGSIRVMKTLPDDTKDILDLERLRSQELGGFRERITTMSQLVSKHQFCLPDETPVPDTTSFKDYVDLLDETCPYESSVPAISLRFREVASNFVGGDKAKSTLTALGVNSQTQKGELTAGLTGSASSASFNKPQASLVVQEMLKIEMTQNASCPSSLDELQWSLVMKNCQVMHGWYTDPITNQLKMASNPAFSLKSGLNLDYAPVGGDSIAHAIPNYRVTDGTKIDVEVVESDLRNSLVRNFFEKSSTDGKIAMGYSGLGISATTGTTIETQHGRSSEQNSSVKKMIGKYMLPRATLYLSADDLVPTEKYVEDFKKIRDTKDSDDIRKFHRKFGQFFCHEVTLGGMLLSTKTLTNDELVEKDKNRDSFKHAIGLTVSSPVDLGADSKKESTRDSDQDQSRGYKDTSDCVVFEAIGGNTILASNPGQWCPTVGNHVNWRVIERTELRSIVDSLLDIGDPRFTDAAETFSGATQGTISKSIHIPRSSKIYAQFRFQNKVTGRSGTHYLHHDIYKPLEIKTDSERPVLPSIFQGPRAAPYKSNWEEHDGFWTIVPILDSRYGMHRQTRLLDGSPVTIRSGRNPQNPWFLSVLRTSLGLFVPCITTSEQFVWRIREVFRSESSKSTLSQKPSLMPLHHNTSLCLTFEFEDNPRGYRDFINDDRGSRNVESPSKECKRLVLVESPNNSSAWQDRGILLLVDADSFQLESTATIMTIEDVEITVKISRFNIAVRDGMDDDYDILLKGGEAIAEKYTGQKKKLKAKDQEVKDQETKDQEASK